MPAKRSANSAVSGCMSPPRPRRKQCYSVPISPGGRKSPMRPSVFVALLAALLAFPAAAIAQTGDAGPDQSMIDQNKAAHRDLPTPSERQAGGGEDSHADADCGGKSDGGASPQPGETGASPGGDPRADRARCRKLSDTDIATAPIAEARVPS